MNQKPPSVQVVKVNADGIRANIHGKKYCYNAKTGVFYVAQDDQWVPCPKIPKFHQSVLQDRHSDYLFKEKKIANAKRFRTTQRHFDDQAFLSQERNA